jgi:hypothetical protein
MTTYLLLNNDDYIYGYMTKNRILFIIKKRSTYGVSYGLLNSCRFLCNALDEMGYNSKIVEVNDNNDIDREVTQYKPTHVFIEALWVVPSKFKQLIPLHPNVKWYVRLHSNTPFISGEGIAIEWIIEYIALGIKYPQFKVACNAEKLINDLEGSLGIKTVYAPNIYMPKDALENVSCGTPTDNHVINIGCFGAIRPLKNQLIQAMAAIAFGKKIGRQVTYHINHSRVEANGEPTLRNIQALFAVTGNKLETHEWLNWHDFIKLVRTMDLGLQVSFSETFNIVAADFVYVNVPIVGSKEIEWMSSLYQADCTDINDIVSHLEFAWQGRKFGIQTANRHGLREWNEEAREAWKKLLKK